jgi:histone-lysine N-methyltransferase SETMAR
MHWKHPASPLSKKFRTWPSAGKVILTLFWDFEDPTLECYQERGTAVTSVRYCDILLNELKLVIHKQRRRRLLQDVLLHDSTCPHSAAHYQGNPSGTEALDHPPYSPDLAPSDSHLFGPLKEDLRGHRFADDDEVKEVVHDWLRIQPKKIFFV